MAERELVPLPFNRAAELAETVCHANKIKVSKQHLRRVLKMKNAEGTGLRFFYSVEVRCGRGIGFMIVNNNNDFGERLLRALEAMPPSRRAGNIPIVNERTVIEPAEG